MQYHLNGYRSGDPAIAPSSSETQKPESVDVLIIGCGPAGLTLAAQLSAFPSLSIRIIERKPGPLEVGQADGIACRSVEMFEALGFAEKVLKESYWVNEVTFWRPDTSGQSITRVDRVPDVEHDLSEMPHVILNQARIHDFLLEKMRQSAQRLEPEYQQELQSLSNDEKSEYPIIAKVGCTTNSEKNKEIRAKYVVGCDGARSTVRQILGHKLEGEAARQLWGVMDVLAVTDFPDIRFKCAIQSAEKGSMLIIPREGGYMVRLYIELDELHGDERAQDRQVDSALLINKAQEILSPHTLDVKEVAWWSAYEIGQRVCDSFDNVAHMDNKHQTPSIFIAGDACHTHSPKAGQGMNVSMADGFNLGWKLAAVLLGRSPATLLHTYSEERVAMAKELIEFDKDMARLFSAKPKNDEAAAQFQRYFQKHGRYTAGVETRYSPNLITGHDRHQSLANGMIVGKRFHSAPVIRVGDGKPMQLAHSIKADGRWRLFAFAGRQDRGEPQQAIARLCEFLHQPDNPGLIDRYTPQNADIDSIIDTRAVFQCSHHELDIRQLPSLLLPRKGCYQLIDYEKIFCKNEHAGNDIYELRGIDINHGVLLIVRPDQYIAQVLPLDSFDEISAFFNQVLLPVELSC